MSNSRYISVEEFAKLFGLAPKDITDLVERAANGVYSELKLFGKEAGLFVGELNPSRLSLERKGALEYARIMNWTPVEDDDEVKKKLKARIAELEANTEIEYLMKEHPYYAEELGVAIKVWRDLFGKNGSYERESELKPKQVITNQL